MKVLRERNRGALQPLRQQRGDGLDTVGMEISQFCDERGLKRDSVWGLCRPGCFVTVVMAALKLANLVLEFV